MKTLGIIAVILTSFVFLVLLCVTGVQAYLNLPATKPVAVVSKYDVGPVDKTEILELVNAERAKVGAIALTDNSVLDEAAQWKAQDMANRNYFAHKLPGTDQVYDRAHLDMEYSVCSGTVSENLLKTEDTSRAGVHSWMISKEGHREALLDASRTITGIGIAKHSDGSYDVAELFCTAR